MISQLPVVSDPHGDEESDEIALAEAPPSQEDDAVRMEPDTDVDVASALHWRRGARVAAHSTVKLYVQLTLPEGTAARLETQGLRDCGAKRKNCYSCRIV